MMTKTQQYCLDCEKLLDSSITAEREFMDASVFRPLTDASGHVHYTQKGICDKCGESKVVSCYELLPEATSLSRFLGSVCRVSSTICGIRRPHRLATREADPPRLLD